MRHSPARLTMSGLWKNGPLSTNIRQEGDLLRLQSISPMQKGGARTTYYGITCFTVCALVLGGVTSMDVESVSSEDSFSKWLVPADPRQENDFLLKQLQYLSSSGITGQKAIRAILQLYPDEQKKVMVARQIKRKYSVKLACGTTKRPSMTLCGKPWHKMLGVLALDPVFSWK